MLEMAKKDIMPAAMKYIKFISETVNSLKSAIPSAAIAPEVELLEKMSNFAAEFYKISKKLESDISAIKEKSVLLEKACYLRDVIIKDMDALRVIADSMEEIMPKEYYPYPNYSDILFSVI